MKHITIKLILFFLVTSVYAGADKPLPILDNNIHMGVASCANSVCHGAVIPFIKSDIGHDEYTIWHRNDPHSLTYKELFKPEYVAITRKLGLKKPHEEKTCLVCHATYLPEELQGRRFSIKDGIGCETCHGGAENYIATHTDKKATRETNRKDGLFPTDNIVQRLRLCLSCHYGNENQFVSHEIMGAGHPRMSFEMDTFTALLKPHYKLDADYKKRKTSYSHVKVWALGQSVAAESMLNMFDKKHLNTGGLFPELSLFDCHSCHHPMSKKSWKKRISTNLRPGSIPINDSSLTMLRLILKSIDADLYRELTNNLKALHTASNSNSKNIKVTTANLKRIVKESIQLISDYNFKANDIAGYTKQLIKEGISGEYRNYISAEQCVMAISALTVSWNEVQPFDQATANSVNELMESLYASVENDEAFNPYKLSLSLKKLEQGLFKE